MFNAPVPSLAAFASESQIVSHDTYMNQPVFTELARSCMPLEASTSLSNIFPDETIWERMVIIDRYFETTPTIFPLVKWCKPDLFVDDEGRSRLRKFYQPLAIRQSMQFCWGELNNVAKEGCSAERANPQDIIAEKIRRQVRAHNLTWDVYRAMMLLGGINYTDPRTMVPVNVSSMIPAHNLLSYNTTSGWNGRNEASLFRSLVDSNAAGVATSGVPFTNPDIAIVDFFRRLKRWHKDTNKTDLTVCYCHPDLKEIILMSSEMKLAQGGLIPKFGAQIGDRTADSPLLACGPCDAYGNAVGLGANGDIISIAGIRIESIDTIYKDPVDGIDKRVFPKNKLVFVAENDCDGRFEAPGRTQYCSSESPNGQPGLWTRTEENSRIPAAPGFSIQMGNAGLPYLKYPDRVVHVKVAEVDDINQRLGIVGNLGFAHF